MNTIITPFENKDFDSVVELFDQNTPMYFSASERDDLIEYLKNEREDYFIYRSGKVVVASGGINYFPLENKARISWDLVSPEVQGKGIGRELLEFRLKRIRKHHPDWVVEVRTSQHAFGFYQKSGFEIQNVVRDYWAQGFDLYEMRQQTSK